MFVWNVRLAFLYKYTFSVGGLQSVSRTRTFCLFYAFPLHEVNKKNVIVECGGSFRPHIPSLKVLNKFWLHFVLGSAGTLKVRHGELDSLRIDRIWPLFYTKPQTELQQHSQNLFIVQKIGEPTLHKIQNVPKKMYTHYNTEY
jgi:hypothetical protein